MAIQDRNLTPGTRLVATYKKQHYYAQVTEEEAGKLKYRLVDGREFKSPSAAGSAITGKACNGWTFWSVVPDEAQTVETTEASPEEPPEEASKPQSTYWAAGAEFTPPTDRPRFHRVPNQKNVDQGQVRLHCYSCRSSFIVPDDQQPDTCPMGHEPV